MERRRLSIPRLCMLVKLTILCLSVVPPIGSISGDSAKDVFACGSPWSHILHSEN